MTTLQRYRVSLIYPKASRLPIYCEDVNAPSQSLAIATVRENARIEGWKEAPSRALVTPAPKEVCDGAEFAC